MYTSHFANKNAYRYTLLINQTKYEETDKQTDL